MNEAFYNRFVNKKVIITGAGGVIGSHLAEELVIQGAKVRCIVHYNSRNDFGNLKFLDKDIFNSLEIIMGDIRDPFMIREMVRGRDIVFHLAALIGIPYSYVAPKEYIDTNILGTLNILESCRFSGVSRLIHTSTSEAYGSALYTPIDEDHALQGQSPYSASKIGADKIAESYYRSFDLPVVTIRPFNNYGPRQSQRAVIPTIISQIMAGEKVVKLGSLSPVRDLLYVKDTVNGFLLAANMDDIEGETINLGFGKGIAIGVLALLIADLYGTSITIEEDSQRVRPEKSEVLKLICNNKKAKDKLGWIPKVSLNDGLISVIKFMSENKMCFMPRQYVM